MFVVIFTVVALAYLWAIFYGIEWFVMHGARDKWITYGKEDRKKWGEKLYVPENKHLKRYYYEGYNG